MKFLHMSDDSVHGGHACQGGVHGRGACVALAGVMCGIGGGHVWQVRQPLQWAVCILLECILVFVKFQYPEVFNSFKDC